MIIILQNKFWLYFWQRNMKGGLPPHKFRTSGGGEAAAAVPPAPPPTLCENASVACGYHLQLFDEQFADPVINKIKTGISHLAILLSAVI